MSPSASTAPLRDIVLIELTPRDGALDPVLGALPDLGDGVSYRELESPRVTVYLSASPDDAEFARLRARAQSLLSPFAQGAVSISRLKAQLAIAGASAGDDAAYRYVVRTGVVDGGATELEQWYDVEHMPSLAAVPGTVLAQRMLCLDTEPRYFACYDLTAPEVLRSGPWLDVRATDWSARVRPTFRDTRRVLSRRLEPR